MTLKYNGEELALAAQEIGAEVIRSRVRYPDNQPADAGYLIVHAPIIIRWPPTERRYYGGMAGERSTENSYWFWALIGMGCWTVIVATASFLPAFLLNVVFGWGVSTEGALFTLHLVDWRRTAVCAGIPWLVLGVVGFARWPRSRALEGPEDTEQRAE